MGENVKTKISQADLKAAMDAAFKYQIGDLVVTRAGLAGWRAEAAAYNPDGYAEVGTPLPEMVVSRLLEECHGGVQVHCLIRRAGEKGATFLDRWNEMELAPYADVLAVRDEMIAKNRAARTARRSGLGSEAIASAVLAGVAETK